MKKISPSAKHPPSIPRANTTIPRSPVRDIQITALGVAHTRKLLPPRAVKFIAHELGK